MDTETKQLYIQLVEAGRYADAKALENAYNSRARRTAPGELGERGELVARGRQIGLEASDLFVPEESAGSKFIADMGAGFQEQGLGINQFVQHATPGVDTTNIDERVREADRQYQESGLADEVTGGKMASYVIPAAAGGLLARAPLATAPLRTAMGLGAAEELATPVLEEDYWTGKTKDVAFGATIGAVTEGIPASMIRGTEMVADAPGAAYRRLQEPKPGDEPGWFRGAESDTNDILAVREETGIDFTPGQVTQSGGVMQVEELARSGLFTRNKVAKGDKARAGQYEEYIKGFTDSLGEGAPPNVVAPKLQAWGRENAQRLVDKRHTDANFDYGPVQRYDGGRPVIDAPNYVDELETMVADGQRAGATSDVISAGKQAQGRLDRITDQGGRLTGHDVELLTRATDTSFSGNPFDVDNRSFNEQLAGRLNRAVMEDIKDVPAIRKQLLKAKKNYANNSSHIDEFENSILGKTIGDEFANEIDGVVVNSTAPETLFQKFKTAKPSEITAAFRHLDAKDPDLANGLRSSILERAREASHYGPPAGGPGTDFDPATFLRNMGVTRSGEGGMQGVERLAAIFPDNPEAIQSIYRAGLILGDKSLQNTSKTAVTTAAREAFQMAGSLMIGAYRNIMGTLGGMAGLHGVANSMDISQGFRVAPQPVNLGRTRRVHERTRIPAQAIAQSVDDTGENR